MADFLPPAFMGSVRRIVGRSLGVLRALPMGARLGGGALLVVLGAAVFAFSRAPKERGAEADIARADGRVVIALAAPAPDSPAPVAVSAVAVPEAGAKDAADVSAPAASPPVVQASLGLPPAPDMALVEVTQQGNLPKIGEDGRRPWQVYARSFSASGSFPRLALVVGNLGESRLLTDRVVETLPADVTLAFSAGGERVAAWMNRARARGHETLLDVPMEPFDYPRNDPGPGTLLTSLGPVPILERLYQALRQGVGFFGVTSLHGAQFSTQPEKMRVVLTELNRRGLAWFEARPAPRSVGGEMAKILGLPAVESSLRLDLTDNPAHFLRNLESLVGLAKTQGAAVGVMAAPTPLSVDLLAEWLRSLPAQGVVLVPASSLIAASKDSAAAPAVSATATTEEEP